MHGQDERPLRGPPRTVQVYSPLAGHHQMIDQGEPVPTACYADGPKGPILRLRGATGSVAVVVGKNAGACRSLVGN